MTRALADYSRPIRLPVHMSDCVNSVKRTRSQYYLQTGRNPTEPELAAAVGISEAKLRLAVASSRELVSLEEPCYSNKNAGKGGWGGQCTCADGQVYQVRSGLLFRVRSQPSPCRRSSS